MRLWRIHLPSPTYVEPTGSSSPDEIVQSSPTVFPRRVFVHPRMHPEYSGKSIDRLTDFETKPLSESPETLPEVLQESEKTPLQNAIPSKPVVREVPKRFLQLPHGILDELRQQTEQELRERPELMQEPSPSDRTKRKRKTKPRKKPKVHRHTTQPLKISYSVDSSDLQTLRTIRTLVITTNS
ncbi:hypothetical protein CFD26_102263 [Aspergillus turcosus]|uniref:Uncharacterized protein n=1 Tax=Aspergillus turcosus TaxID=1245748 RepID=A0A3R7M1E2_9EURO|nr:hypothetical protein CFD26_102263 [Aspergillus turcosus]